MEKSLQKVDIRYEDKDGEPDRRSTRSKMEKDYSKRAQDVAANKNKIDDRVKGGDTKAPLPELAKVPRSRHGIDAPPPDKTEGGRKRKSRGGRTDGAGSVAGKGIDSDPFMRCFLREVDGESQQRAADAGSVLYLYPLVEYREDRLAPPKVEPFYDTSSDGEGFPAPKVFLYSPSADSPDPYAAVDWVKREEEDDDGYEEGYEEGDRCALCDRSFADKTCLQEHMVCSHVDERENRCEVCSRRFDTVFKARSHVMMEHVDVDCRCCLRRFADGSSLRRHMVATHGGGDVRLGGAGASKRCEVCLEGFRTASALADHVESEHASLLEHRCDLCARTFLAQDELFAHVDRDPHVCLLCSAYFESTLGLRHHLLGHATDSRVVELFTAGAEGPGS